MKNATSSTTTTPATTNHVIMGSKAMVMLQIYSAQLEYELVAQLWRAAGPPTSPPNVEKTPMPLS